MPVLRFAARQNHRLAQIQFVPRHCFAWRFPRPARARPPKHPSQRFLRMDISPPAQWRCSRCRCRSRGRTNRGRARSPNARRGGLRRAPTEETPSPASASNSVSGRGTSAWRFTAISKPQNEVEPVMCCNGSRCPRRLTSSRSASVSAGVSTRSKFRYNFMRGSLSRCASRSSVCRRGESTPFLARNSALF